MSKQNDSLPFHNCHEVLFAHSVLADEILSLKRQTVPATSNTRPLGGRFGTRRGGCIPRRERGREIKKLFEPRAALASMMERYREGGRTSNENRIRVIYLPKLCRRQCKTQQEQQQRLALSSIEPNGLLSSQHWFRT